MILPVDDRCLARKCQQELQSARHRNPVDFLVVFVQGGAIQSRNLQIGALKEAGLIQSEGGFVQANYRIFPLEELFFVTDFPRLRERHRVFPIFADESALFATRLAVEEGTTVLDVFTGSGILAIVAAKKARIAIGIDSNPKALNYAKFNALLNGAEDRTLFLLGDVCDPVFGSRFNYISANPPFVAVPPGTRHYLHSDGGCDGLNLLRKFLSALRDGLNLLRKFLSALPSISRHHCRMQFVTMALGDRQVPTSLLRDLATSCGNTRFQFELKSVYDGSVPMAPFFTAPFESEPTFADWSRSLQSQKLTHQHYVFADAFTAGNFAVSMNHRPMRSPIGNYSGSWRARRNRYVLPMVNC